MQSVIGRLAIILAAAAAASCTDSVRQGTGSSFLIVNSLQGASGAEPSAFGATLQSDIVTIVDENPSTFSDLGQVTFTVGLKDPERTPTAPQNLGITVDRYRVRFIRADGRNTPGVHVPFPFDGAFTLTIPQGGTASAAFTLVRHVAKQEAPLGALVLSPEIISTIAEVTFFGRDQTGHEVSVTAQMGVEFGNFADPD